MFNILFALVILASSAFAGNGPEIVCESLPNSGGQTALINYTGSFVRESNSLTISLAYARPNSFAQLTCGTSQMNMPFGNGILCINPLNNFVRVGQPVATNSGTCFCPVNLMEMPYQQTLYFQWWYRDNETHGYGFNTSDAMRCQIESLTQ